jgi:hypothetical protein
MSKSVQRYPPWERVRIREVWGGLVVPELDGDEFAWAVVGAGMLGAPGAVEEGGRGVVFGTAGVVVFHRSTGSVAVDAPTGAVLGQPLTGLWGTSGMTGLGSAHWSTGTGVVASGVTAQKDVEDSGLGSSCLRFLSDKGGAIV